MAITAKYETTCGVCGEAIAPGALIDSLPSGSAARWAHAACGPDSLFTTDSEPSNPGEDAVSDVDTAVSPASLEGSPLEVWTDGACSGNPGPGGWAWATRDGRQGSGGAARTTNQRMEIQAALAAVTTLEGSLIVVSDSTYVVNCFRDEWWRGWLARGWTNSAKKPVANRDLWEPLVAAVRARDKISFRWVKGHSGDQMNDLVDRLAVAAAAAHR